jgi:glutaredoxin
MGLKSLYYLKSSSLLTKKKVIPALIVSKEDCPWCQKLKEALAADGIQYKEISKSEAVEKGYWDPEWKTVPQMWLYKKHIGGYTDYMQLNSNANEPTYETCLACES